MPDRRRHRPDHPQRRPSRLAALGGLLALLAWRQIARRSYSGQRAVAAAGERERERPMTAYEPTDWDIGPIAFLYAGIIALLVICCFVLIAAYPTALPDANRNKRITPPGPRLQTDPAADLRQFRAKEQKRLETYYWVDKQNGVVHIPIDEAMKKIVQTGIPGFPKAQP